MEVSSSIATFESFRKLLKLGEGAQGTLDVETDFENSASSTQDISVHSFTGLQIQQADSVGTHIKERHFFETVGGLSGMNMARHIPRTRSCRLYISIFICMQYSRQLGTPTFNENVFEAG